jgi:hypothetical protein
VLEVRVPVDAQSYQELVRVIGSEAADLVVAFDRGNWSYELFIRVCDYLGRAEQSGRLLNDPQSVAIREQFEVSGGNSIGHPEDLIELFQTIRPPAR